MAITKPEKTNFVDKKGRTPSSKTQVVKILVIKVDVDDSRIKAVLSQNAILFKELSIYSMDDA